MCAHLCVVVLSRSMNGITRRYVQHMVSLRTSNCECENFSFLVFLNFIWNQSVFTDPEPFTIHKAVVFNDFYHNFIREANSDSPQFPTGRTEKCMPGFHFVHGKGTCIVHRTHDAGWAHNLQQSGTNATCNACFGCTQNTIH